MTKFKQTTQGEEKRRRPEKRASTKVSSEQGCARRGCDRMLQLSSVEFQNEQFEASNATQVE